MKNDAADANDSSGFFLTPLTQNVSRARRFLQFQMELWRFCLRRLNEHNSLAMSSALAFRSIFALIPALVLAVLVLKSFGILENSKATLQTLLENAGVTQITIVQDDEVGTELSEKEGRFESNGPQREGDTQGDNLAGTQEGDLGALELPKAKELNAADEILELVGRVEEKITIGTLGPVGAVLFVWTALTLMMTIESSLNRVYEARQPRGIRRRVMMYWSVLTLGPLVLVSALYLARKTGDVFGEVPVISWIFGAIGWAGSVITGIILLATLYRVMPNTRVQWKAAVGGAIVAVLLWLIAKWGFGMYVTKLVVGKASFYGALGLLPLFFMWVNLSWTIFLFGAELSHTAANLKKFLSVERARRINLGPSDLLAGMLAIARSFVAGRGPVGFEAVMAQINLPNESVHSLLERLEEMGLVTSVGREPSQTYTLTRPAEMIPVLEAMGIYNPDKTKLPGYYQNAIAEKIQGVNRHTYQLLGNETLAGVLEESKVESRKSKET